MAEWPPWVYRSMVLYPLSCGLPDKNLGSMIVPCGMCSCWMLAEMASASCSEALAGRAIASPNETIVNTTAVDGMTCGMVFLLLAVASSMTANSCWGRQVHRGSAQPIFSMVEYNGLTDLEAGSITFWAVRFPVALEEFLTVSLTPVLAVAMYRVVIPKLPGEAVPLALRAQATEDAIEDPPQVHPSM